MKTVILCACVINLCGCAGVLGAAVNQLPSVQNCQKVEYNRDYGHVQIHMDCMADHDPALPLGVLPK